ncbi:hypothetical protein Vadar_001050 [Vaccinium darrowii]|uniref:Uncharacterized protein n=1 Tax=Vaccinium darrowii TaxID=229202 RepID=A0ACB7YAW9_9ERIC|nr:hypothetical protein Vadar_001050 [Vaccinium darrowii]
MDNLGLPKSQLRIQEAVMISLLTCPLCDGIFKEATTIIECLHTFCKDCIYQKHQTEGITCCPRCNEDLSHLSPEDYLRPDERWRNLVNSYLHNSSSNEEGQIPQAKPPPSIATSASESTAEPLKRRKKKKKKNKNKKQKTDQVVVHNNGECRKLKSARFERTRLLYCCNGDLVQERSINFERTKLLRNKTYALFVRCDRRCFHHRKSRCSACAFPASLKRKSKRDKNRPHFHPLQFTFWTSHQSGMLYGRCNVLHIQGRSVGVQVYIIEAMVNKDKPKHIHGNHEEKEVVCFQKPRSISIWSNLSSKAVSFGSIISLVAGNWPFPGPALVPGSYIQGACGPMLIPVGMVPFAGWNPYQGEAPVSSSPSPSTLSMVGGAPVCGRPGQPECQHYLKTGEWKFGSSCRYHHPREWSLRKRNFTLSPIGLPLRPPKFNTYSSAHRRRAPMQRPITTPLLLQPHSVADLQLLLQRWRCFLKHSPLRPSQKRGSSKSSVSIVITVQNGAGQQTSSRSRIMWSSEEVDLNCPEHRLYHCEPHECGWRNTKQKELHVGLVMGTLSHLSPEDYLRPDENWRILVKSYLVNSSTNDEGETQQATPPPSIAATASTTTKSLKKNKKQKTDQFAKEPTISEQSSC